MFLFHVFVSSLNEDLCQAASNQQTERHPPSSEMYWSVSKEGFRVKIYANRFRKLLIFNVFPPFSIVKVLHLLLSTIYCQIYPVISNYNKCRKVSPSYLCLGKLVTPVSPHIACLKGLIRRKKHQVFKINIGTCDYFTPNNSELVTHKGL